MPKEGIDSGDRNLTLQFVERCALRAPEMPLPQTLVSTVRGFRDTYEDAMAEDPTTVGGLFKVLNELKDGMHSDPQTEALFNACYEALPAITLECQERGIDLTGILKIEATAGQIRDQLYRARCIEALQVCVTLPIIDKLLPLLDNADPMMQNFMMILVCCGLLVGFTHNFTHQVFDQREAEANDAEIAPIVARFNEWVDHVISGWGKGIELKPEDVTYMLRELKQLERYTDPEKIEEDGARTKGWRERRPDLLVGQERLRRFIDQAVPKFWKFGWGVA